MRMRTKNGGKKIHFVEFGVTKIKVRDADAFYGNVFKRNVISLK